jgi:hypothetical protein
MSARDHHHQPISPPRLLCVGHRGKPASAAALDTDHLISCDSLLSIIYYMVVAPHKQLHVGWRNYVDQKLGLLKCSRKFGV